MHTLSILTLTAAFGLPVGLSLDSAAAPAWVMTQDDVDEIARGAIKSIDAAAKSFVINSGAEGAKDITVRTDEKTIYMLDGKVSTRDEVVKKDARVTVTHKKGMASKVEGTSK
jgi:hypothetical protein